MAGSDHQELKKQTGREGKQEGDRREALEEQLSTESPDGENAAPGSRETGERSTTNRGEYLLITLALLLIVIAVGGGMFIWARYGNPDAEKEAVPVRAQHPLYQLDPFFVPLREVAGTEKFLRITISLELSGTSSSQTFVKRNAQIRGILLQALLGAVPKDFEYSHGKKALMDAMRTALNHFLGEEVVGGIRFTNAVLL